jgi:hypothetical protein
MELLLVSGLVHLHVLQYRQHIPSVDVSPTRWTSSNGNLCEVQMELLLAVQDLILQTEVLNNKKAWFDTLI